MADDSILIPGYQENTDSQTPVSPDDKQYLLKDNYLTEFSQEELNIVRENLGVPSKDNVYTKSETNNNINQRVNESMQQHLGESDPHSILPEVNRLIQNLVKNDGTTPFKSPQEGKDPINDNHLATKRFVDSIIKQHLLSSDPHKVIQQVETLLTDYILKESVYDKSQVFTKDEVNRLLSSFLKKDGSTPFTEPQIGIDPVNDGHLTTKRFVEKLLYNHNTSKDPHNFSNQLSQKLANYAKKDSVYTKDQTYSSQEITRIINNSVKESVNREIQSTTQDLQNSISDIQKTYIKSDGSVPFTSPQKGVNAVEDNDLVTLSQLTTILQEEITEVKQLIDSKEPVWITSGPVDSTVGFLEIESEVPKIMPVQDVLDEIFYGKKITLSVQKPVLLGSITQITVCIKGSLDLVDYAEVYQDSTIIKTLQVEDFETDCYTLDSLPITKDTEIKFKVYYKNGTAKEVSELIIVSIPIFIGLLPKWKFGHTVTMDYLVDLSESDPTNNKFFLEEELKSLSIDYNFTDVELKHPFVVVPTKYPNLESMTIQSQSFSPEAFETIDMIPLSVNGIDIIYKIYIYKQALSSLSQKVTFNFNQK